MKPLKATEKSALRLGSRSRIQVAFAGLKRHLRRHRWIASANRYRKDCIGTLGRDASSHIGVDHRELEQYIAASALLHCMDGWGFLGAALDCHSQNDADEARHLAYYGELRGAAALLATEGIGVFCHQHFVVDALGSCHLINRTSRNTHEMA